MTGPPDLFTRLRSLASIALSYAAKMLKLLSIIIVPIYAGVLIASSTSGWLGLLTWLGMLLVALASVGLREYPITAFGTEQRVDETLFTGEREHCAECGLSIDRGQYRQYAEQYVVFGYPLYTTDWGENAYCPWCADGLESPAAEQDNSASQAPENERAASAPSERTTTEFS